jgi:hypothetical protein
VVDLDQEVGVESNGKDWYCLEEDCKHCEIVILVMVRGESCRVSDNYTNTDVVDEAY